MDHTLPTVSSLCGRSAQSIPTLQSSQLSTRNSLVSACYRLAGISSGKYKSAYVPALPCSEALAVLGGCIGKATTAGAHAVAPHSAHADVELRLDRHPGRASGERRHSELPAHTQWCRRPANRSPYPWHCSRAEELGSDKPAQCVACSGAPRGASALYCFSPRISCLSEEATDPQENPCSFIRVPNACGRISQ